jgi:ornithine decarboxylase
MKAKFYLNKTKLLEQYKILKEKGDIISYSLKTNFEVGKILEKETNCWTSVHFLQSLEKLEDKSRALFFAQALTQEDLKTLFSLGVNKYVVDNKEDLKKLVEYVTKNNKQMILFLRMRMKEHTIHTGKHFVFGMLAKEVNQAIAELKNNSNITLGIHFHRKTQNIHEWSMHYELKDSLTEETLSTIKYLNMGGGIPVSYKNSKADRIEHIFSEITKLKQWLKKIKLVIEPGRFIAAPCVTLKAQITNIYNKNVVLNCSVYNAAMDTFVAHTRLVVKEELEKGQAYTLKGCTPDSLDIFRYRIFLDNPKIGDTITFLNAGAYTFNSNFCLLPKIETVIEE